MSMKKRFISLAAVSVVVVGGWFGLAYRPAQSKLNDLRADVTTTRQEVQALESKLQRLLALQANEGGARDAAQRIVGALPADPKVSDFILKVQDAANAAGIDFLSIAPSLPAVTADAAASAPAPSADGSGEASSQTPASRLRTIAVQIKADGGYFEIEDFTLKMEQLARALRIDDFSLTGSQDQAGGTKLSASMKLQMFMLTPQAAAPAPAATNQGT